MYDNYRNPVFEETNPVKTLPIIIAENGGQVYMDKINIDEGSSGDNESGTAIADRPMREQQLAICSRLRFINESINTLCVKREEGEAINHCRFQTINKNIQRMTMLALIRSSTRMTQEQNIEGGKRQNVSLSNTPRTLYDLWEEYTKGLGGAKAAKDFTEKERGAMKHRFLQRNVFWDCVIRLVNSGLSAYVAINKIYESYGRRSTLTKILREMSKDSDIHSCSIG